MSWGIWKKIKNGIQKGFNWVKNKILKPVGNFAKNVVKKVAAPIISAKGKIHKTSGDIIGQVAPGPIGMFAQTAGNLWGTAGDIAEFVRTKP